MSLLNYIEPERAEGNVAEIYNMAQEMMGYVPNALKLHSVNPLMLEQLWQYMGSVMNHPTLSGELFTCIRMLTSIKYECDYCIRMNESMLMNMSGWTGEQVQATKKHPDMAPLPGKEIALLEYVVKAVADSNAVGTDDVQALKDAGCTDVEIYDALRHGANQVMGDILLNAFKVEYES